MGKVYEAQLAYKPRITTMGCITEKADFKLAGFDNEKDGLFCIVVVSIGTGSWRSARPTSGVEKSGKNEANTAPIGTGHDSGLLGGLWCMMDR